MVAIVSGDGLGLFGSSANVLGNQGAVGDANVGGVVGGGSDGSGVYVNAANGNLILQARDEFLASLGFDTALTRTYNSQGKAVNGSGQAGDGDNGDNWRMGALQSLSALSGTVNTAGSSVTLTETDGTQQVFTYDAARGLYVSTSGAGAYDTLSYQGVGTADMHAVVTRGASNLTETYNAAGFIVARADADGNTTTYGYGAQAGLVTSVTLPTGDVVYLDYTGSNLTAVRTVSNGVTQTRDYYSYDAQNRLIKVTVDLSPEDNSIADNLVYTTVYTYDGLSDRIATIRTADNTRMTITYTQVGGDYRVASIVDGQGYTTSFTYDTANLKTDVNVAGAVSTFSYDAHGQLLSVAQAAVDGVRSQTSFTYDANGNVTKMVDGNGNPTTMDYDLHRNLVRQQDALGNVVARTYNSANQVLTETLTGPSGDSVVTRNVYDSKQHLVYTVSADGRVTELQYNSLGEQTAQIMYAAAEYDASGLAPGVALTQAQLVAWTGLQNKIATQRVDFTYDFRGQLASATSYATVDANGAGMTDTLAATTRYVYDQHGRLLQTIDPRNAAWVTTYAYDGLDRLSTMTDVLSNVTATNYYTANNRTVTRIANGMSETSVYDAAGRLLSVSQRSDVATFGTVSYAYNAAGMMTSSTDATGAVTRYVYDAIGRQTAVVDPLGDMTEYVYDADNNVIRTIAYAQPAKTLVAGAALTLANLRPAASAGDRVTRAVYDQDNRLAYTVDAAGYVTQQVYDAASRVVEVVGYASALTPAQLAAPLTAAGLASALTVSAQDRQIRNFYDRDGHRVGQLDGEGYLTLNQYDAAGNLTGTTAYATATASALRASGTLAQLIPGTAAGDIGTHQFYNARGQLTGSLDAESYLTELSYDKAGNLVGTRRYATATKAYVAGATLAQLRPATTAADQVQAFTYTGRNQLATVTNVDGSQTTYTYDAVGELTSTVVAAGSADARTTLSKYDLLGNKVAELTGIGASLLTGDVTKDAAVWAAYGTTYKYDLNNRLIQSVDALGNKTSYFYDAAGRQTRSVNALGEVTAVRYDSFGEVTDTTQYASRVDTTGMTGGANTALLAALATAANPAQDSTVHVDYDARGEAVKLVDQLGKASTRTYDAFGKVIGETLPSGTETVSYSYDKRGLLTGEKDQAGALVLQTKLQYDAFGRLISSTDAGGQVRTQEYDRDGRVVATHDALNATVKASYDAFGRVVTQTDANGNTTRYAYDDATRSVTMTTPDGIHSVTTRNREGQVISLTDGNGGVTSYSYDKDGNLTQTKDALGNTITDTYDKADRLLSSVDRNGKTTTYTYDAANRVLTQVVDATGLKLTTSYAYDAKGETTAVTDPKGIVTTTAYDQKGEVVRVVVDPAGLALYTSYSYDAEGRVLSVRSGSGATESAATNYVYDGLGRRTQAIVDPAGLALTTSYTYDASGNPLRVTDANGHVTTYAYDAENRVVAVTDAMGGVTRYGYDANGNRTSVTDANGGVSRATYTAENQLASSTDALGNLTKYSYDADGNLSKTVDANGNATSYVYDKLNRLTAQTNALGGVTTYTYDKNGNVLSVTDPKGNRTTYTYVGPNRLDSQTDALGNVTRYAYAADGNRTSVTDARGVATSYAYDAAGRVLGVTQGTSNTAFAYDAAGNIVAQTDANGHTTRYAYDGANRLVSQTDALGNVTSYAYDAAGNRTGALDASGNLTRYAYDADNRLLSQTDALGNVTSYAYDANGNRVQVIDANGHPTGYTYDADNRLLSQTDALGGITLFRYDAQGNLISTTAPGGQSTSFAYDALGRMTGSTDALGFTTHYAYDVAGNRTSVTDASGHATTYAYDADNRLVGTTDALGHSEKYAYDAVGNRSSATDRDGNTTRYVYDANNRLLSQTDALGAVTAYQYDTAGNRIAATDANGNTTRYTYDAANRLTAQTDALGNTTTSDYDANGNRIRATDANGWSTFYAYDADNRLVSSMNAVGARTEYSYDAVGNVSTITDADGNRTSFGHDALNRVIGQIDGLSNLTAYQYDANGNVIALTDANGNTTTTTYDAGNRQTSQTDPLGNVTSYTYDERGNQVTRTDANGAVTASTYDALNRLVSRATPASGLVKMSYDANGNLLSQTDANGAITSYQYDAAGRLISVRDPMGGTTNYAYDLAGNRLGMIDANGNTTLYRYDADNRLVSTTDPLGGETSYRYDAVGRQTEVMDADGHLTAYVYDGAGRLIAVDNGAGGITHYDYDGVGNRIGATDGNGNTTRYGYDANNRLLSQTDALGNETRYGYDAVGNRMAVTDGNGNTSMTVYDADGRVIRQIDPLGLATASTYDAVGNLISVTAPDGKVTTYTYDLAGRMLSSADGLGVQHYSYDIVGNLTSQTDRMGNTTLFTYDANHRLLTRTDALGHTESYFYDAVGNRVGYMDKNGFRTGYAYDADNRLVSVTDPTGAVTTYQYDPAGNRVALVDPLGNVTSYTYDGANRLIASINAGGETTNYAYDPAGNRIASSVGNNPATTYEYDAANRLVAQVDPMGGRTVYMYDRAGRTTTTIDANGSPSAYDYDADGRLVSLHDPMGGVTLYSYDAGGNRTQMTDPNGNVTTYEYDPGNRLIRQTDALQHVTGYSYDANGNLLSKIDPNLHVTEYAYDKLNRLTSQTDALGSTTTYAYDTAGNRTQTTDAKGNITAYIYDADNRLVRQTDALGYVTSYGYDAAGNRSTLTDANGNITSYAYDGANRLVSQTDPLGNVSSYAYDAAGNRVQSTDANGNTTYYTYDANNRLVETDLEVSNAMADRTWVFTGPDNYYDFDDNGTFWDDEYGGYFVGDYGGEGETGGGSYWVTTSYVYDLVGNRIAVIDPNYNRTSYAYDGNNRLISETNALGDVTAYGYDAAGNRTSTTDGNGNATAYAYDSANRLVQTTDALGHSEIYTYDDAGNRLSSTDRNGQITTYAYDADNRLTLTTDALGTQTYVYDSVGNRVRSTDRMGQSTSYVYDADNRLIATTDALGHTEHYAYDGLGNLLSTTDKNGYTTLYAYDSASHLVRTTDPLGAVTAYEYDAVGNRTKMTDANGNVTEYEYDEANHQVKVVFERIDESYNPYPGWQDSYFHVVSTRYVYDYAGNVTQMVDSSGHSTYYQYDAANRLTQRSGAMAYLGISYDAAGNRASVNSGGVYREYTYDAANRAVSATDGRGNAEQSEYDAEGNLTQFTDRNGNVTSYVYDAGYRLVSTVDAYGAVTTSTYDAAGRVVGLTDRMGNHTAYTYDANGRLTSTTDAMGYSETYSYDAIGNRTAVTDRDGNTTLYTYDADNRVLSSTNALGQAERYGYDLMGNLTSVTDKNGHTTSYAYDERNRKVSATDPLGNVTRYEYDTSGNLIRTFDALGAVTRYVYDESNLLKWVVVPKGGSSRDATLYRYDGSGNVVEKVVDESSRTAYQYDNDNHLIEARFTSDENQYDVTTYTYDAMGNRVSQTDPRGNTTTYTYDKLNRLVATTDPMGFTTRTEYDAEGHVTATYDAGGKATTYEYDDDYRLVGSIAPTGAHSVYQLDAAGNRLSETTWSGTSSERVTSYTYDAAYRVTSQTGQGGTVTSYTYDDAGNILSQSVINAYDAAPARLTVYTYDADNRQLSSTLDPNGLNITQSAVYDAVGNVVQKIDGEGRVTNYVYSAGKLAQVIDGNGAVVESYQYDRGGNMIESINKDGATSYQYDVANRVVLKVFTDLNSYDNRWSSGETFAQISYQYDADGNLMSSSDGNSVETTYYYDGDNRLVAELDAGNVLHEYDYDAVGNKIAERLYMSRLDRSAHDEMQSAPDNHYEYVRPQTPEGEVREYSFEYDAAGRLVRKVYPEVEVSSVTSVNGNPVLTTNLVKPEERTTYDAYGNVVASVAVDGGRTLTYYDIDNRPVAQVDAMGYLTQYVYDRAGNVLQKRVYATALDTTTLTTTHAPAAPSGQVQVTSYQYNEANQLVQQTSAPVTVTAQDTTAEAVQGIVSQSTASIVTQYVYDKSGNLIRTVKAAGTAVQQTEYSYYDNANRMIGTVDGNRALTLYQYDAQGRVTGTVRFATPVNAGNDLSQFGGNYASMLNLTVASAADQGTLISYNPHNQVTSEITAAGGVSATLAGNGVSINFASSTSKSYGYDVAGNRTLIRDAVGNITQMEYDGLGNMTRIIQADGSTTRQSFDAAGNVVYSYTGETSNNATLAQQVGVTVGSALSVDYDLGTPGLTSYVIWDTVSHDIGQSGNVGAYANHTQQASNLQSSAGHAEIPTPAAGTTLYFRVVTLDTAGNMAFTDEQQVTTPLAVQDVQINSADASTMQVRVKFSGDIVNPRFSYGTYGASNYSSVAMTAAGDGYYVASFPAGTDPAHLGYNLQWSDVSGAAFSSGDKSLQAANHASASTTQASETAVTGGVQLALAVTIPASVAADFTLVTASWRAAGSSDDFSSTGVGGTGSYNLSLGNSTPLQAGKAYEIVIKGVDADGNETLINTYVYTPTGITGPSTGLTTLVWDAPGVGSSQFVMVNGQLVDSTSADGRVLTNVPAGTSGTYAVYYTDKAATAHSTATTSSQWLEVVGGQSVLKGYNVAVKTTLAADEAAQAVSGLHISWGDSGGADGMTFANDALMTVNADGSYNYAIDKLALPAKSIAYKIWYTDAQGHQVIVDLSKTSSDATESHNGTSDIVLASATGGTIDGVSVTAGTYLGKLDATAFNAGMGLTISGTGMAGGLVSASAADKGYYIQSQFNALNVKTGTSGDDGVWTEYAVDADGHAVQTRQYGLQGNAQHFDSYAEYDLRGNQTASYGVAFLTADGNVRRATTISTYDFLNNVVTQTDADGNVTRAQYDALGRMVAQTDALGHTKAMGYDALGQVVTQTDENGNTSFTRYDGAGHRITQIDATGRVSTEQRDAFGRVVATIDGNGTARTIAYDLRNNVVAQDGVEYEYDANNNRVVQHDAGDAYGHRRETSYDALGRVKSETTFSSATRTATETRQYDTFGNVIAQTDGGGHTTQSTYGGFARQASSIDPDGQVINYTYDDFGRKLTETGNKGRNISYIYDDAGHLSEINDHATGTSTQYRYDVMGRQVEEIVHSAPDIFGQVHNRDLTTSYDALGRMTGWVDSVTGLQETITYDNVGNQIRVQGSGGGASVDHGTDFDAAGRVIALRESGGVVATYSYDAAGNRLTYSSGDATTTYTYDGLGRPLTSVTATTVALTVDASQTSYQGYNGDGVGDDQRTPLTVRETLKLIALQQYHDIEQWSRIAADNGLAGATLDGDAATLLGGRVLTITHNNEIDWSYDQAGNTVLYVEKTDGAALKTIRSEYDGASHNTLSVTDTTTAPTLINGDANALAEFVHLGYGNAGLVSGGTTTSQSLTQQFGGDGQVSRATLHTYGGGNKDKNYYYVYSYSGDGRQLSVKASGDATGTVTFTYDVDQNLVKVNQGKGDGMDRAEISNYVYDNAGQILAKYHDDGRAAVLRDKLDYVYVSGHPVAQTGVSIAAGGATTVLDSANYALFQNYDSSYPAASVSSYTVHAGETLESIADAVYGDKSLWYIIAGANGMGIDTELKAGQVLTLPAAASANGVTSDTHKVYNQSEVVGGTLPNLTAKPPKHHGCSGLLKILVIVVAVVVAVYTGGAAAGAIGTALGGGSTAVAVGAVAGAAVGAAAGSIASQAVAIGVGLQDSFDWKAVGHAAVMGGITAGVGDIPGLSSLGTVGSAVATNVITQGIAVSIGLQNSFNWRGVAAAGVAAGVSSAVNNTIGEAQYGADGWKALQDSNLNAPTYGTLGDNQYNGNMVALGQAGFGNTVLSNDFAASLVRQTISNVASGVVSQLVETGKVDWSGTAINSFGYALGYSTAGYIAARDKLDSVGMGSLSSSELQAKAVELNAASFAVDRAGRIAGNPLLSANQQTNVPSEPLPATASVASDPFAGYDVPGMLKGGIQLAYQSQEELAGTSQLTSGVSPAVRDTAGLSDSDSGTSVLKMGSTGSDPFIDSIIERERAAENYSDSATATTTPEPEIQKVVIVGQKPSLLQKIGYAIEDAFESAYDAVTAPPSREQISKIVSAGQLSVEEQASEIAADSRSEQYRPSANPDDFTGTAQPTPRSEEPLSLNPDDFREVREKPISIWQHAANNAALVNAIKEGAGPLLKIINNGFLQGADAEGGGIGQSLYGGVPGVTQVTQEDYNAAGGALKAGVAIMGQEMQGAVLFGFPVEGGGATVTTEVGITLSEESAITANIVRGESASNKVGVMGSGSDSAASLARNDGIFADGINGSNGVAHQPGLSTTAQESGISATRNLDEIGGSSAVEAHPPPAVNRVFINDFDEYKKVSSGELQPNTIYHFDGNEFETDSLGRSFSTRGYIDTTKTGQRLPSVDRAIGDAVGANEYDVGFHRGGDALGFPGGKLNVNPGNGIPMLEDFPEVANLNQGAYKRLENQLRNLANIPGNSVYADFRAHFNPGNLTQRPDSFSVTYTLNGGAPRIRDFLNQPGG